MSISITNGASRTVQVAVSVWAGGGSDNYYPLEPGSGDTWGRNDPRGYLMAIKGHAQSGIYYVAFDSQIVIEDNLVKDRGQTLKPLASNNQ
ncbi:MULTISPECIES: hypothetical protein [unclassified Pseudomonas]|uniref:hypothetical protein n=1 Tax=unclassified Pseudomonas TaxID=196821 RepID=UPI002160F10E|nr:MULTISPECIES: hypothetical protein [unclassified Pseudomonas]UVM52984.1 hypothetical protein LOY38_13610 [Pseudomonas sp. B21-015]WPN60561.1 hypothetical protein QMK51_13600 [Pseudomonas sp. P9_31]